MRSIRPRQGPDTNVRDRSSSTETRSERAETMERGQERFLDAVGSLIDSFFLEITLRAIQFSFSAFNV